MLLNHFWNKIPYDATHPGLMMEEVTQNNFIFSLPLKSNMLTESGCLPNRHLIPGSFSLTEKQKEGNTPNQHNMQSPGFALNPSTDPSQDKLHSMYKICRTRKTRKIFFPCSSLRGKAVWEVKRILPILLFFFGEPVSLQQSHLQSWLLTQNLHCSIQHTLVWGSRVTELNFIKNGTEEVMNCDEKEMRVIFPLTRVLYMIPESPEHALCIPPSLVPFICPFKRERKWKDFSLLQNIL